jgi:hypothetical protein
VCAGSIKIALLVVSFSLVAGGFFGFVNPSRGISKLNFVVGL